MPIKTTVNKLPLEKLKILDICQQVYKQAEELYQHLSTVHREQREIARMWGQLAADKCNHSDAFKMAARLKGEGISEIQITLETATVMLAKLKTFSEAVQRRTPTVIETLGFMIKVEENLNRAHFQHAVAFANDRDMALMTSSLKSSSSIIHMLTEEYVNMTMLE